MPLHDIFSKRKKRAAGKMPDVYTYDEIPGRLRVQIVHIWNDALGVPNNTSVRTYSIADAYHAIVQTLRREYGQFVLHRDTPDSHSAVYSYNELNNFFLDMEGYEDVSALDKALDVIELSFRMIDGPARDEGYLGRHDADEIATNAIDELNARFKEHGVGYFYSDGTVMRVDSEFVHSEIVKPALVVLRQPIYSTAQAEFLKAHEYYRGGKNSEALIECYKAFESTMKIICTKRK
jgi:hypothetical protein